MEVSGQLHPSGKKPWYPLDRKLGGPRSRSGRGGEEKNSQSHQESNPRTPIVQPVAQGYTDWATTALKERKKAYLTNISLWRATPIAIVTNFKARTHDQVLERFQRFRLSPHSTSSAALSKGDRLHTAYS
jgi:hypothetical protein